MLCTKTEMCIELEEGNAHKSGCYLQLSVKDSWKKCCLIKSSFQPDVTQTAHCLELCFSFIVCCSSSWFDCLRLEE